MDGKGKLELAIKEELKYKARLEMTLSESKDISMEYSTNSLSKEEVEPEGGSFTGSGST